MRLNKGFDSWVGKFPWRKKWQPTPVFLPGESQRQRSLVGYSSLGRKESDMTDRLHFHFHLGRPGVPEGLSQEILVWGLIGSMVVG